MKTTKRQVKTVRLFQTVAALSVAALLTQLCPAQPAADGQLPGPGVAQPHLHVKQDAAQPAATANPTGVSPTQIRQAYGFDLLSQTMPSLNGAGQIIAIVDAFGDRYATITTSGRGNKITTTTNIADATLADWTTFCTQFGLPGDLTVVYPQGQGNVNTNWALETALDIQWAHAIAPGAKILLVVAYDNSNDKLFAAVDYAVNAGASVVSMSWGGGESSARLAYDAHFQHPGGTFVASSGDGGEGMIYPAVSPYVVSVGGTTLTIITNADGSFSFGPETAWSGSGGGISAYVTMPGFQSGWQQFPTGNMRSGPDVSYTGGPGSAVSVYCGAYGGWIRVYGTSVGAPQWAALLALANSGSHFGTLSGANPIIYSVAAANPSPPYAINPNYLNDITSGTNGPDADDFALVGYDYVTGLGSPKANNLVPALISALNTPDFFLSVNPSSQAVPAPAPDGTISWTATYSVAVNRLGGFADGVNLTVSSGLPNGASASFAPALDGNSSTLTITVPTTASPGAYALTITGTDAGNALSNPSRTASAELVISSAPTSVYVVQPSGTTGYSVSGGKNLTVQVLLLNNFGNPVSGASVSTTLYLNGASYGSASATTDSTGTANFIARNAPAGTYTTKVTNVSATGLTWDGKTPANSYTKTQ